VRKISRLGSEARLGWSLVAPALSVIALIAIFPLGWTFWESLHLHELRMPWLGEPFIGLANYVEIAKDPRFWAALGHTAFFTVVSISLELLIGLFLALAMNRVFRGRGFVRAAVLVPWAIPTVVAALLWRFIFESQGGIANALMIRSGILQQPMVWFIQTWTAWVPVILADVWKTTPFVALLLLAGLQNIDESVNEAAALDGATEWRKFRYITVPMIRPTLFTVVTLGLIGTWPVFDQIYVGTKGSPLNTTLTPAFLSFSSSFNSNEWGVGAAIAFILFAIIVGFTLLTRVMTRNPDKVPRRRRFGPTTAVGDQSASRVVSAAPGGTP